MVFFVLYGIRCDTAYAGQNLLEASVLVPFQGTERRGDLIYLDILVSCDDPAFADAAGAYPARSGEIHAVGFCELGYALTVFGDEAGDLASIGFLEFDSHGHGAKIDLKMIIFSSSR